MPIVFFQETTIHFIIYGEKHLISIEEGTKLVFGKALIHINKGIGKAGEGTNGVNFAKA